MAFRLSQKAFGQLLRTQSRALTTSTTAARTFARSTTLTAPAVASCSRTAFVKAFSTSRAVSSTENQVPPAAAEGSQASQQSENAEEQARPQASNNVYFGNLPFFTDKPAFEQLLNEFGPIERIHWSTFQRERGPGAPLCFVTFQNFQDAQTIVESSRQEPFYFGGRNLRVEYARQNNNNNNSARRPRAPIESPYPPTNRLFFTNFTGDLAALKEHLGDHSLFVNHAFFSVDRETGETRPTGVITFSSEEAATNALNALKGKPGPEGSQVYLRYAKATFRRNNGQSGSNDSA